MEPLCKKKRSVSDWSGLPPELLMIIAKLLGSASVEDLLSFGRVCRSWMAVAKDTDLADHPTTWPDVPLLMLPEKNNVGEEVREFYSVSTGEIIARLPIPELKGKKYVECGFGWFLIAEGMKAELLNPFCGTRITCPEKNMNSSILRAVLSANPSHTSDFIVFVATDNPKLAFWRNGERFWTSLVYGEGISDLCYCNVNHRLYAVTSKSARIWMWQFSGHHDDEHPRLVTTTHSVYKSRYKWKQPYLVQSSAGELLLVAHNGIQTKSKKRVRFRVYRVDVERKKFKMLARLKDEAIFIGQNSTMCINVRSGGRIKPNSIYYFTDDSISADPRVARLPYHTHDISFGKDLDEEEDRSIGISPALWVAPSAFSSRLRALLG